MKGHTQRPILPRNRHRFFLHGLKQRRLRARTGAVNFISHQQLAKHWPLDKAKLPRAIGCGL